MTAYRAVNPYTNEPIREYAQHDDAYVERALVAAHALYRSAWAQEDLDARRAVLARIGHLLRDRAEDIARTMTLEMGKLIGESLGEIGLCASIADHYAEHGQWLLEATPYETALGCASVEYRPTGVIVAVEPWNFPIYQLIRVLAPNLLLGNPVLLKHSELVPGCAQAFERLVADARAPAGAYANLFITHDQVAGLIDDDRVQGVALTGSERAGAAVAQVAGRALKKTTLELGGSDVFVVLDDADVDDAALAATIGRLGNSGQGCTSAKRFIVQESVAEGFVEAVTHRFAQAQPGDPLDPTTTLAPLVSRQARDRLRTQVDEAISHGARVLYGNEPIDHPGNFLQPTLLGDISRENPAHAQEFFGPVAQLYVAADDDQIVRVANDSPYGLGGAIFSQDVERATRLARRIDSGMLFINKMFGSVPELPFGGIKRSGFGRELGDLGVREFANAKLVMISESGPTFG